MKIFFIYTPGLRGPVPEIHYDIDNEYKKTVVLQKHELPTEYKDLTLNQLSMIYPYKGNENEKEVTSIST